MRKKFTRIVAIAAVVLVIPGAILAQTEDRPPLYVSVDCMKSTAADYVSVEIDIWQPIHQELVNRGKLNSWALYWVRYGDRSKCDYYTVATYLGAEQLNANPPIVEVFQAVHPDVDFAQAMATTWESREHVDTELWLKVDGIEVKEHHYAVVNKMSTDDPDAYQRMETRVFKPGHQALADGGYRSGWAMYELLSPIGTSIPYNFSTVDFVRHLNPVPMAEAMIRAHPDRDLFELQELLELRDQVSSTTWELIAITEPPASSD